MNFRLACQLVILVLVIVTFSANSLLSQPSTSEQIQVSPPPIRRAGAPSPEASAEELEKSADELRTAKAYLDALDYYKAALAKKPGSATLYNKLGITELMSQRYREAQNDFERAIKLDPRHADAYNNLGVLDYLHDRNSKAVKQYTKAIALDSSDASYYCNLGAAYFSKKDWEKSMQAYSRAVSLDPDIFENVSTAGVAGQISSPSDRAHFSFALARLYAKDGLTERSLEYLRRAMEEGYKGIDEVYKDAEFTELRKDPRFSQLMAARPLAIPE